MSVVYGGLPGRVQPAGSQTPLASFGIFSDVQFNCQPNNIKCRGWRVRQRYNQTSMEQLHAAVEDWGTRPVSFVINLGDLTEVHGEQGYNRDNALQEVLCCLDRIQVPKYHILGHHDLKQFTRAELLGGRLHTALTSQDTETPTNENFYYHFCPCPGIRIVVLDLYEMALIGYADQPNNPHLAGARRLVSTCNPNPDPRHCENMPWQHSKYTSINGGCSAAQLKWFEEVLQCSQANGETVIVCGHNPLCATSIQRYSMVTWSNDEILRIMYRYTCAQAYFGGHDGDGGYVQDDCGLHHVTLPGIIETPPDSRAHATVHICEDRLEVVGCGRMPNMTLFFCRRPLAAVQIPGLIPSGVNLAGADRSGGFIHPSVVVKNHPEEETDIIDKILDKMSGLSICGSTRKKKMVKMGLRTMGNPPNLPQAHISNFCTPGQLVTPSVLPPPKVKVIAPAPAPGPALLPKHNWSGCVCGLCQTCNCGPNMFCNCARQGPTITQVHSPPQPILVGREEVQLHHEHRLPMVDIYGGTAAGFKAGEHAIIRPNQACGNNQQCGKPLYPHLEAPLPTVATRLQRTVQVMDPPIFKPGILKPSTCEPPIYNTSPAYEVPFPGKISEPCGELPPRPCPTNCPPYQPLQAVTTRPIGHCPPIQPPQPQPCFTPVAKPTMEIVPQRANVCGINCGCQQRKIEPEIQHIQHDIRPSIGAHGVGQVHSHGVGQVGQVHSHGVGQVGQVHSHGVGQVGQVHSHGVGQVHSNGVQYDHINGTGMKPVIMPGGVGGLPGGVTVTAEPQVRDNYGKTTGPIFI